MLSRHHHPRYRSFLALLALGAAAIPAAAVSADTIWYKSAGAKTALKYDNIKIEKVDGDNLLFLSASGNETKKPLAEVSQIAMDDEPNLTAAELAYDGGNFAGSIEGFRKAAASSGRDWVRQRAALRLIDAGTRVSDFQASVAGFATLTTFDAAAAQKSKPAIPANASVADLKAAATTVHNAQAAAKLSVDQQRVLLNFQVELLTAAHDTNGASAALNSLSRMGGGAPSVNTGGTGAPDATADLARADEKLNAARFALDQKEYQKASGILLAAGDGLTAPEQQNDALFMLAQCKEQLAGEDPKALTDAAIAYMRVVANFKKVKGSAHIPDALMKTAAIEEKLSKPEEALKLYNEVSADFQGTSFAQAASDNAVRITAALKSKG
jgi:TolA-binding protein